MRAAEDELLVRGDARGMDQEAQSTGNDGGTDPRRPQVYVDSAGLGRTQGRSLRREIPPQPQSAMQQMVQESTGELLPVYGRDLFLAPPSTFAPGDAVQVSGDYLIGPGDEILLRLWGEETRNQQLTVDRGGNIFIPQFGAAKVAGLRFSELQPYLERALRNSFRNFTLSVDMGRLRSISVIVLGEAAKPGSYTISAQSTLVNAVMASGGPSVHGSMRAIELRRDGKTITTFDFYDLLQRGDRLKDMRLQPGDIVFIPTVRTQVAVVGGVERPAIYEVLPGETLVGAIALSGGYSATAAGDGRLFLERLSEGKGRVATELELKSAQALPVQNGDVLRVGILPHSYQSTVTLRGNLAEPGRFKWKAGMRLSDILPEKTALLTQDYWEHRNALGMPILDFRPQAVTAPVEAGRAAAHAADNTDMTTAAPVSSAMLQTDSQPRRVAVTIAAPEINWNYAVVERLDPQTLHSQLLPFNLGRLVEQHDASQDLPLLPGDVVTIFSHADVIASREQRTRYVRLEGEFVSSGVYSVLPEETLVDVIRRAGGLTHSAYLYGASFTRESTRALQQQRLDEYLAAASSDMDRAAARTQSKSLPQQQVDSLNTALAQQKAQIAALQAGRATGRIVLGLPPSATSAEELGRIDLEDGDVLRVPSRPMVVNVVGAVQGQTSFRYNSVWKLKDYLEAAGDLRPGADRKHAFLIRADGSVIGRASAHRKEHASFDHLEIYPGDTLVVPYKPIEISGWRSSLDYTQMFSQYALGVASLAVVATR